MTRTKVNSRKAQCPHCMAKSGSRHRKYCPYAHQLPSDSKFSRNLSYPNDTPIEPRKQVNYTVLYLIYFFALIVVCSTLVIGFIINRPT